MIDYFALALSHGLMLLAAWRLVFRPDIDDDDAVASGGKTDIMGRPLADETRGPTTRA